MGGFSTGNLKAGGEVRQWEKEIMREVAGVESQQENIVREVLNQYFSNDGI